MIAQRIMRKENFMIAFFNHGLLDLTIPLPWKRHVGVGGGGGLGMMDGFSSYGRSEMSFYSRSLEVSDV